MKLTIDNMDGVGETDHTALLDAEAPPKIVRKLNQAPTFTAWLMCQGLGVSAAAGSKVRLYRDSGELWFSGYLEEAPQRTFAGRSNTTPIFRVVLKAKGEMSALDRGVLSERAAMGGRTAGQAIRVLTQEANAAFDVSAGQDVAEAGTLTVKTGELWSVAAGQIADCARAVLTVQNRALTLAPLGAPIRLTETDPGFSPESLKITVGGAVANDLTVVGGTEPAMYVRDCFTSAGRQKSFALSRLPFKPKTAFPVEDDFHATTLDATKWASDFSTPLTFTQAGVSSTGPVALRYRDRLEIGGLIILEQTGINYASGEGVIGGLFSGGFALNDCIAGVLLNGGQVQPIIDGVVNTPATPLLPGKLYEFRTLIFHPEPVRAGQVYSSSVRNGASARSSQVWSGTTHIVLTMRQIDPANASTTSTPQIVLYDGTLQNVPVYADYLPMWGLNFTCTLGHARVMNEGAVWVQSAAPGQPWRTRVIGDVTAGAECYLTSTPELDFTTTTEPVANEQIEVFYRSRGMACGRVVDSLSMEALRNSEDNGARSMVVLVTLPAPRTSLDCEQAARALLDDLTQAPYSGEYQSWIGSLPQGASDVQPGEQWDISAQSWGLNCTVMVRDVEIDFQNLSDEYAQVKLQVANDSAQPITLRYARARHNALITVVSSDQGENVSARPSGLPDVRIVTWGTATLAINAGVVPVPGGGVEVRVEGDWGWGMAVDQNLVGRFPGQNFTLPRTAVTQEFYLRQFDGSTPAKYSPYATVLHLDV